MISEKGATGSVCPIYIISLRNAIERRALCETAMTKLGLAFQFFDAINGLTLSDDEIAENYDGEKNARLFKRPLVKPEIGCYMSHLALWRRIADGDFPAAVVLEDDFEADCALPKLLRELTRMNIDNHVVKLHSVRHVVGEQIADFGDGHLLIAPNNVPGHTLGYVIGRTAATKLANKAAPFGRPVDMDLKHWWEFDISVLVVQPNLLEIGPTGANSAIGPARDHSGGRMNWMRRFYRNLRYQIPYRIELMRALSHRRMKKRGGDADKA